MNILVLVIFNLIAFGTVNAGGAASHGQDGNAPIGHPNGGDERSIDVVAILKAIMATMEKMQVALDLTVERIDQLENSLRKDVQGIKDRLTALENKSAVKVAFDAVRLTDFLNGKQVITYEKNDVNLGGGFSAGTGTFTVPVTGMYLVSFTYTHISHKLKNSRIQMRVDKKAILATTTGSPQGDNSGYGPDGETILLQLTKGQQIDMFLEYGGIWGAPLRAEFRFMGILLHPL